MTSTLPDAQKTTDERWRFWRDVLVFELKMFIGNLRDFALMPVSVLAAMIDLVSKGEREGSLFYRAERLQRLKQLSIAQSISFIAKQLSIVSAPEPQS